MSMFDDLKDFATKLLRLNQRVDAHDETIQGLKRDLKQATSLLNRCVGELKIQKATHRTEVDSLRRELEKTRELVKAQLEKDIQASAYSIRDHLDQRLDKRVGYLEERLLHSHRLRAIETPTTPPIQSDDSDAVSRIAAGHP
jgi:DNA anti-recombination protein RmuC